MTNIIICGIVKNVGNKLRNNIRLVKELKTKFNKCKLVIYENNSNDNTKTILKNIENEDNIKVIMENISDEEIKKSSKIWAYTKVTSSDHPCRIEQISNARNKLIEEINKKDYDEFSVVVMIDLDSNGFNIQGIVNSVKQVEQNEKIVITGNSNPYYDYYALRSKDSNLLGPELIGEKFWKILYNNIIELDSNSSLREIYSGFNGVGVYHTNVFKKYKYNYIVDDNVKNMYAKMFNDIDNVYNKFKIEISKDCDKFPNGIYDEEIQGYWKNNSGYDKPVVCEHVCLHAALINDGYKIYINPQMLYVR